MTVEVAEQGAFVALTVPHLSVAEQTAYAAILPGTRATVAEQSAYIGLFSNGLTQKPRRSVYFMIESAS